MKHDAIMDPHHSITLVVGDRLKARRFTDDLRAGDLYEVTGFVDEPFPNNENSRTHLHDITTGRGASINTGVMQARFRDGAWALA